MFRTQAFCLLVMTLLVSGCNIGFEQKTLQDDTGTDSGDQTDGTADVDTDMPSDMLDIPVDMAEEVDGIDVSDMADLDDTFSNQNCSLLNEEVRAAWDCIGAPSCGISLQTVEVDGTLIPVVVCAEGGALAWYAFSDNQWQTPFTLGAGGDRPLPVENSVAIVRRDMAGNSLEWLIRDSLAPNAMSSSTIFGSPDGTRAFSGDLTGDDINDLVVFDPVGGDVDIYDVGATAAIGVVNVADLSGVADASTEVVAISRTNAPMLPDNLALVDLTMGTVTFWDPAGTAPAVTTATGPVGTAAVVADIDLDLRDELIVCRDRGVDVWSFTLDMTERTYPLPEGVSCLPGAVRTTAAVDATRAVAYLSAAGLLLRAKE